VLEDVVDGTGSLPLPLVDAIGAQRATTEEFARQVLKLLD
jgi:hypothetical protein